MLKQDAPDEYAVLRTHLVQQAKDHPDDPLALALAGRVLIGIGQRMLPAETGPCA